MKKIKYPRYNRNQDLRCKLKESDVKIIRDLKKSGLKISEIRHFFKDRFNWETIRYNTLTDKQKKERNRKNYLSCGQYKDLLIKREQGLKSVNRKLKLMPEFKKYAKYISYKNLKKNAKNISRT